MKVTLVIAVLLVLALAPFAVDAGVIGSELAAVGSGAAQTPEPAVLLASGAALLGAASLVRRCVR
jgi:hypothetical protein